MSMDQIKKTFQEAWGMIKDQANAIGDSAKEKSFKIIESWLKLVPVLEEEGFELNSFSTSLSINPSVEVELLAESADFTTEKIEELLAKYKGQNAMTSVLNTIKVSRNLYVKAKTDVLEPMILKLKIKLSPEIQVFFGQPMAV